MAHLDSLRNSLDRSTVDLFLDGDVLYALAEQLWALCAY